VRPKFRAHLRIGENGKLAMMKTGTPGAALAALLLGATAASAADIPGRCRGEVRLPPGDETLQEAKD
jgi:hypothetical protein